MSDAVLGDSELPDLLSIREQGQDNAILTSRQWPAKRRDILARLQAALGQPPETVATGVLPAPPSGAKAAGAKARAGRGQAHDIDLSLN